MNRMCLVAFVLFGAWWLGTTAAVSEPDFVPDFVPGAEREITRESANAVCAGDSRSPACALETLFLCMARGIDRSCVTVGVREDTDCYPDWIAKIRYAILQVYGIDKAGEWAATLSPLTAEHRRARIVYRATLCADGEPCDESALVRFEDAEKVDGTWRLGTPNSPDVYENLCYPSDT